VYSALTEKIWKPKSSVKIRFALAQGMVIAVIIGLLAITLYFPIQSRLVSITDNSYKILSNNLAASIYSSYTAGNRASVINSVRLVADQQGVKYVLVVDKDDNVFYDTISGASSLEGKQYLDDLSGKITKGDSAKGLVTRGAVSFYNYVSPVISSNQVLYSIRLGVDKETIDGQFNRLAGLFVDLAGVGILVGIIAAYVLAARLSKPIILLTESALAIRAGNLNAYPEINTNDELEQLSREFQGMVEKLKQFYFQEYSQKKEAQGAKKRLEEINERLLQLDHQKSDFMNAASHQLRTPLSIIHWSLSVIVEEAAHLNLKPEQKELLEESLKSTKRMVDLVNDLLDISRIEQGRKELSWAKGNFGSVCSQLVTALQVLANNKQLKLTYEQIGDIPDSFLDEKNFYQVVNNFVDNAVKYTAEGWIKVTCQAVGKAVEIRISDSGIGMTDEEKASLFTRFSRGSEASKMFANGSGLGMYVARAILLKHGGNIVVQSEKGKGTLFILTVPLFAEIPNPAPDAE
jgi:signal transduction histidine kinase